VALPPGVPRSRSDRGPHRLLPRPGRRDRLNPRIGAIENPHRGVSIAADDDGGGGNRTRVRGRTDRGSTSVVRLESHPTAGGERPTGGPALLWMSRFGRVALP